jgi:hypothetical protein
MTKRSRLKSGTVRLSDVYCIQFWSDFLLPKTRCLTIWLWDTNQTIEIRTSPVFWTVTVLAFKNLKIRLYWEVHCICSEHLKTRLVWFSNSLIVSKSWMVPYSATIWNLYLKWQTYLLITRSKRLDVQLSDNLKTDPVSKLDYFNIKGHF